MKKFILFLSFIMMQILYFNVCFAEEDLRVLTPNHRATLANQFIDENRLLVSAQDEKGNPVEVAMVGTTPNYVVDDAGFRRHIESETVDRQVIELLRDVGRSPALRNTVRTAVKRILGQPGGALSGGRLEWLNLV